MLMLLNQIHCIHCFHCTRSHLDMEHTPLSPASDTIRHPSCSATHGVRVIQMKPYVLMKPLKCRS